MTTKKFNVKYGLSVGTSPITDVIDENANGTFADLTVNGTSNLGNVGNVHITGGSNGQVLTTNGNGALSWANGGSGSGDQITNGNSNVVVIANGNVTTSVAGVANVFVVTSTGANVDGTLTVTGVSDLGDVGNLIITGGNGGEVLTTDGSGNLSWSSVGGVTPSRIENGTSNVVVTAVNGNITTSVDGVPNVIVVSNSGSNVSGYLTVTGNVVGGNVVTSGIANAGSLSVSGVSNLGLVGNVIITGGSPNQYLKTNGSGGLSWGDAKVEQPMIEFTGNANGGSSQSFSNANISSFTSDGYAMIFVNGVLQSPADYNIAGNTLTMLDYIPPLAMVTVGAVAGFRGLDSNLIAGGLPTELQYNLAGGLAGISTVTSNGITITYANNEVIKIGGGSNGQVLSTDGAGNLSWVAGGISNSIVNGTSNVVVALNGNVNTSVAGVANVLVVAYNGITVNGESNLGPVGNVTITGGSSNQYLKTNGSGGLSWESVQPLEQPLIEFTGNVNGGSSQSFSNANIANFTGDGYAMVFINGVLQSPSDYDISGNTLTMTSYIPPNAMVTVGPITGFRGSNGSNAAGGSFTELQYNQSGSLGGISTVTTDGTVVTYANNQTIKIGGGSNGQVLTTDGAGNLTWETGGGTSSNANYANYSNIANTANAVAGANVSGEVANANYAAYAGVVTTNAQPNITSVGNLTGLTVQGTTNLGPTGNIKITGGNDGQVLTASGIMGNVVWANIGNVANANYANFAAEVTDASQPNITSLGNLINLTVNGITNLGSVSNVTITGGSNGQFLRTNGSGALTWATVTAGSSDSIANGLSSVSIPAASSGIISTVGGVPRFSVHGAGAEVTNGNFKVTNGTSNLGVVGNVFISGGSNGQFLQTNGNGNLSWATPSVANANYANFAGEVTNAAQPNVTSVGTLSGLTVNGTVTAVNVTANTGVFTGNGSGLSALVGANVTGTVANANYAAFSNIANTANAVTLSNVANVVYAQGEIHVTKNGNDTTGNGALLNPYVTIGKAISVAGSGSKIMVHPGGYTEDVIVSNLFAVTISTADSGGAGPFTPAIYGNLTVDGNSSAISVKGIGVFNTVTHSASGSLYITNMSIGSSGNVGTLNKSGSGYLSVKDSSVAITSGANLSLANITGGNTILFSNVAFANLVVSNSAAQVNVTDGSTTLTTTLTAGTLNVFESYMYTLGNSGFFALSSTGGTVNIKNSILVNPNLTPARVNLSAGTIFAYSDLLFDGANSNLGIQAGTTADFQAIRVANGVSSVTLSVSGNANVGNIGATNFVGNGASLTSITGANVTGTVANANVANTANAVAPANVTQTAWTTYTPSWTASTTNPTIGDGTITGRYQRIGGVVSFSVDILIGSTTTFGSGNWRVSLPANAQSNITVICTAVLLDSGTRWYNASAFSAYDGSNSYVTLFEGASPVSSTAPFTWANGDRLIITGTYETA